LSIGRACVLLLALSASAGAQGPDIVSSEYEALIRSYASGEHEAAVTRMVEWPPARVLDQAEFLAELGRVGGACVTCREAQVWRRIPVEAAVMLHSDCAQRARRDGLPAEHHEQAAVAIARRLKDDTLRRVPRGFVRRWFEAVAGLAQAETRWDDALAWTRRGLREFPASAELLLVVGSIEEMRGAMAERRLPESPLQPSPRVTLENLSRVREARAGIERAHRALRQAVAADPAHQEARLRLGRVAMRLGETAEARAALEGVLARDPMPEVAFLAHLFLGRLQEEAGRHDDAAGRYQAALAIDPLSQSARLALSHSRLRLGDAVAARREVETAVQAARRAKPDAYWLYPWGSLQDAEARLGALRREVSS